MYSAYSTGEISKSQNSSSHSRKVVRIYPKISNARRETLKIQIQPPLDESSVSIQNEAVLDDRENGMF